MNTKDLFQDNYVQNRATAKDPLAFLVKVDLDDRLTVLLSPDIDEAGAVGVNDAV